MENLDWSRTTLTLVEEVGEKHHNVTDLVAAYYYNGMAGLPHIIPKRDTSIKMNLVSVMRTLGSIIPPDDYKETMRKFYADVPELPIERISTGYLKELRLIAKFNELAYTKGAGEDIHEQCFVKQYLTTHNLTYGDFRVLMGINVDFGSAYYVPDPYVDKSKYPPVRLFDREVMASNFKSVFGVVLHYPENT